MKAQLIDLGRNNINKTVEVKDEKALHKEIGKHILSKVGVWKKRTIPMFGK